MRAVLARSLAVLAVCALLLLGCGDPSIAPHPFGVTYAVTDLGLAPRRIIGGDLLLPDAFILGINRSGQIIGDRAQKPFFWTPTTPNGMTGTLVDLAGVLQTPCFEIRAINAYGQVAGLASPASPAAQATPAASSGCSGARGEERAFLWTPRAPNGTAGTVAYIGQDAGVLTGVGVWALNDWGQVLLEARSASVLWTPAAEHGALGVMTAFSPVGQDSSAEALGLNAYGQVIAQSYNGDHSSHAFLWTPTVPHGTSGTVTVLQSDGGDVSAINDYGQVLGASSEGTNDYVWTPTQANGTSGGLTQVGPLSGDDSVNIYLFSDAGAAGGNSFHTLGFFGLGSYEHAAVWLPNGSHQSRGELVHLGVVGSDADSWVNDVNAAGQAVGRSCTLRRGSNPVVRSTQPHAFVWDKTHGLHDLQGLLDGTGATFHLEDTKKISDQGQIVAIGDDANQQPHLVLLTPQP
jgi:uncharacterized membrane protein